MKRIYVTIRDTEGTVWLNTGSFPVTAFRLRVFVDRVVDIVNWIYEYPEKEEKDTCKEY